MFRIDDPSAVPALPAPEAAGTEGYFTEGTPGVQNPTLVRGSWLNMIQEELRAIVAAVGLTPSKTVYNQVLTAIKMLHQTGVATYVADTGTANTYQVAYSPAITALTDGMVLKFKAKTANTGASTFSPNGLAAAPVWGSDHAALGGGEIIANGDVWVQWNSSINAGAGAWVLIKSTGGYVKSPTPSTGDRSNKLATTQMFANEFASSLAPQGWGKLPDGRIEQWGTWSAGSVAANGSATVTVTLPTAWTSAYYAGAASPDNVAQANAGVRANGTNPLTQINIVVNNAFTGAQTITGSYRVIGK